jgi:predicted ATP-grasp superfamily ATP-dependent carboligase
MKSASPLILVHEFVTGGGWPEVDLPPGLAAEALAMLQAALADFRAWGRARIVTTRDSRLTGQVELPADETVSLQPSQYPAALGPLAARCDAALLIAPESDGTFAHITALVAETGAHLLGSSPAAVTLASDKWACYRRFKRAGLPTPATWRVGVAEAPAAARSVGLPLVVKPVDGVGGDGVVLVTTETELVEVLALPPFHPDGDALLQQFIAGTPASVSLLVAGSGSLPLSLNEQVISGEGRFIYEGGRVLTGHPQQAMAFNLAQRAVALIPGLRGYVGVDISLTNDGCTLIEINSRLTSSYIGLRQVININLAEAIYNACYHNVLPRAFTLSGQISFRKTDWLDPAREGVIRYD